MSVAAVILAAGASSRLGQPKQLALVNGERLLERAARVAGEAGCLPVIVVLGAGAEQVRSACSLGTAKVVVNPDWAEGMGGSVRVGVATALPAPNGVLLMTCDQPAVTAGHLLQLTEAGVTTASAYAGRSGVPAYFPASALGLLCELHGDAGARELLTGVRTVALLGGELDVDTPATLAATRQIYG